MPDERERKLEEELKELERELKEFQKEKDRVRMIVGRIGGVPTFHSKLANILFFLVVIGSVAFSLFVHDDKMRIILIDLAVGVLSIKILYVIHTLMRGQHFLFWILSSMEWQVNATRKNVIALSKEIKKLTKENNDDRDRVKK